MEKTKKIKLFIGLSYVILLMVFLFLFFSKFSIQEITSYDFIKANRSYFFELKNSNLFLILIIFIISTIIWTFPLLGFASPMALLGGFIFGKWIGTIAVVLGLSIGGTFLYIFEIIKIIKIKDKLEFLSSEKYDLFAFIKSYDVIS